MCMSSSDRSPKDSFLFQDDPNLQNFKQQNYDADSYDAFAMPKNQEEMNLS